MFCPPTNSLWEITDRHNCSPLINCHLVRREIILLLRLIILEVPCLSYSWLTAFDKFAWIAWHADMLNKTLPLHDNVPRLMFTQDYVCLLFADNKRSLALRLVFTLAVHLIANNATSLQGYQLLAHKWYTAAVCIHQYMMRHKRLSLENNIVRCITLIWIS